MAARGSFSSTEKRSQVCYPILSANFQDNAGRIDSIFGVVKLLGSIFDDTCVFIFGIVGFFLSAYYMDYIQ